MGHHEWVQRISGIDTPGSDNTTAARTMSVAFVLSHLELGRDVHEERWVQQREGL